MARILAPEIEKGKMEIGERRDAEPLSDAENAMKWQTER
jgi:hypothetical protein